MAQIKDLDLICNTNSLLNDIVIYGAGNYGKLALQQLEQAGFLVTHVCDSSANKWGEKFEDKIRIISPTELGDLRKTKNITLIIAINNVQYIKQVLKILNYCGMEDTICYTYFALNYVLSFQNSDAISVRLNKKEKKYFTSLKVERYYNRIVYDALYNLMTDNTILIYQPAKVGSITIWSSILKNNVNAEHIHFLSGNWFQSICLYDTDIEWKQKQQERDIFRGLKKIKIITMVREPIGRDISHFFQEINHGLSVKEKYYIPNILTAITTFLDEYSNFEKLGYQFEWFNHEIKEVFGVDIYKHSFDQDRGYEIIREKNVEILIIKMENLDQCESIIGEFTGVQNFKMERGNSGSDKVYHFTYEEVKKNIRIPKQIVDRYYNNNSAMNHFYTEKEKDTFLKRWQQNIVDHI